MSQFENPESSSGKGRYIFLGILLLILFVAYTVMLQQKSHLLVSSPKEGVIIVGSQNKLFSSQEQHLWSAAYDSSGKQLWKRSYTYPVDSLFWSTLETRWNEDGLVLQSSYDSIVLDEKGKIISEERTEQSLVEETAESHDKDSLMEPLEEVFDDLLAPSEEASSPESSQDMFSAEGYRFTVARENSLMLQCWDGETLIWDSNLDKRFRIAGTDPKDPEFFVDEEGDYRVALTLISGNGQETRQSMSFDSMGDWDKWSLREEESGWLQRVTENREKDSRKEIISSYDDYYVPVILEIQNQSMEYKMRKGYLEAINLQTMDSWEKRVFLPLDKLLEDYL